MVFIVSGLVAGAAYGLLAVGLIFVFRSTNVLNFAHGAIGTLGAYLFATLARGHRARGGAGGFSGAGIPVGISLPLTLAIAAIVGALLYVFVFHRLSARSALAATVASVVLVGVIQGFIVWAWGTADPQNVPLIFPFGHVQIGGASVTYGQLGTLAVAGVGAIGLAAWLRRSTLGLTLRALSDNRRGLQILGVSPIRLGTLTWAISTAIGTLAAILLAPSFLLYPGSLDAPLAKAFGAALIGGLRSAPVAVAGGLGIGIVEGFLAGHVEHAGLRDSCGFALILVLLIAFRRQIIGTFAFTEGEARA